MILYKEGIPIQNQRLQFNGETLNNNHTLHDNLIGTDSILDLSFLNDDDKPSDNITLNTKATDESVVCFGKETRQKFSSVKYEQDDKIRIEPFVIEMKLVADVPRKTKKRTGGKKR